MRKLFSVLAAAALIASFFIMAGCKGSDETSGNVDITGTWSLTLIFDETSASITFNGGASSGTLSTSTGDSGTYSVSGSTVEWSYQRGHHFTGQISSERSMTGTVTNSAGAVDNWQAYRQ